MTTLNGDASTAVPRPTPLQIGPHRFASNLLLCPIAGYCDLSFRLAIRRVGGFALCYTDLISPRSLLEGTLTALRLAETSPDEAPVGVQLYGCDPAEMALAAQWVEAHEAPAVIDINMGCPVNKVAGKGGGAGLLRHLDGAVKLAGTVAASVRTPVTVKMRLGWSDDTIIAPELARRLEDVGVAAVTVHGRTAEQKFSGKARRDGIARVVEAVKRIPVIGNGDVDSPEAAEQMLRETGCAGVMIGRAALSDQWLFRDALAHLQGRARPPTPDTEERLAVMMAHWRHLLERRGESVAVSLFRQRFSWYAGGMATGSKMRQAVRQAETAAEFEDLVGRFRELRRSDPTAIL